MQRLTQQSNLNSPQAYDAIFQERQKKGVDEHDVRRWKRLLKHYHGGNIADLGCLDSEILEMLNDDDKENYWGIDYAEEAIKEMNKKHGNFYEVGDVYKIKHGDSLFDYAILGEVLEHLEDPEAAIKEAMRLLKPGGVLAISVPFNEKIEPGAVDGDRHLYSFDKTDMKKLLNKYSKKIEMGVVGSRYWPIWKYRYCFPSLVTFAWKK